MLLLSPFVSLLTLSHKPRVSELEEEEAEDKPNDLLLHPLNRQQVTRFASSVSPSTSSASSSFFCSSLQSARMRKGKRRAREAIDTSRYYPVCAVSRGWFGRLSFCVLDVVGA
jgi:hypothetical protein